VISDPEVLGAIRGYRIPFLSLPPSRPFLREPGFSAGISVCGDTEIERLLNKGAIYVVQPSLDQFLSSFFLIEKTSGGMRFILNLKDLNAYRKYLRFQWRGTTYESRHGSIHLYEDLASSCRIASKQGLRVRAVPTRFSPFSPFESSLLSQCPDTHQYLVGVGIHY